jgi:pullulanase
VRKLKAPSDQLQRPTAGRNSYNSGDWFNKLDFTYGSNN